MVALATATKTEHKKKSQLLQKNRTWGKRFEMLILQSLGIGIWKRWLLQPCAEG